MLMDVDVQYACTDACVRMLAGGYASVRILNAVGSGVHFCGIGLQGRVSAVAAACKAGLVFF